MTTGKFWECVFERSRNIERSVWKAFGGVVGAGNFGEIRETAGGGPVGGGGGGADPTALGLSITNI